jgi:uncharacterized protein (TIGR00369 family)
MAFEPVIPLDRTFDALIGLEWGSNPTEEEVTATVPVREALKQPMGLVHGGVFASIAETLAATATAIAVAGDGKRAMGLANATSFMRPITEGTIHATARRLHRGRTTWIWDVEIRDDAGRTCAVTRMTIAVR